MLPEELPTVKDESLPEMDAEESDSLETLSTTLPANARFCYEVFSDVRRIPEWVPSVSSVQTQKLDPWGRAAEVGYVASLGRASVGYTVYYEYDDQALTVSWKTRDGSSIRLNGHAVFVALSERACMIHYSLDMRFPLSTLSIHQVSNHDAHPTSQALSDFREYISRAYLM